MILCCPRSQEVVDFVENNGFFWTVINYPVSERYVEHIVVSNKPVVNSIFTAETDLLVILVNRDGAYRATEVSSDECLSLLKMECV